MDIKIIVATHKKYRMPDDEIYIPVFAGASGEAPSGYVGDNTGDNISDKNKNYCELTALYWAWKNLNADYMGLVHYRRYLTLKGRAQGDGIISSGGRDSRYAAILNKKDIEVILKDNDIILPKPRHYVIETNYSQYANAHHAVDLDTVRSVISDIYPEYLVAYDARMKMRTSHMFNMFIMKKSLLDEYCKWLFNILFELERRLDISKYSNYDARVFGFVAERLLDVWLDKNFFKYKELPYIFMENEHRMKKVAGLIKRKLRNAIYRYWRFYR